MDSLGYSKARIVEELVDIDYGGVPVSRKGVTANAPKETTDRCIDCDAFELLINLNQGQGEAVIYSCDSSEEYIRLNIK